MQYHLETFIQEPTTLLQADKDFFSLDNIEKIAHVLLERTPSPYGPDIEFTKAISLQNFFQITLHCITQNDELKNFFEKHHKVSVEDFFRKPQFNFFMNYAEFLLEHIALCEKDIMEQQIISPSLKKTSLSKF